MKQIVLSLLFFVTLAFSAQAQMFELYHGDELFPMGETIEVQGYPGDFEIIAHMTLKNISSSTAVIKCRKIDVDLLPNTTNTFCWGLCYANFIYLSPLTVTLAPGDTTNEFSGHYMPDNHEGYTTMGYSFFDINNPNDSTYFYVEYLGTPNVGIEDREDMKTYVSNAYPNPASSIVSFDYNLPRGTRNAMINVHNLLGAKVKEMNIAGSHGKISVDVNDLKDGIYFYSVNLDNQIVETKRLIISR